MSSFKEQVASDLRSILPSLRISEQYSWKSLTTLGIGSAYPLVCEPETDIELSKIVKYCYNEGIRYMPIGAGSNILGTDSDFPVLVIRLRNGYFHKVKESHVHVNCAAGLRLYDFLTRCAKSGLGGAAPLAGIPGTIGGAIRMNAGARGCCVADFIESVCGIDHTGENWTASGKKLNWEYRSSSIPEDLIITASIWKLKPIESAKELKAIQQELTWRRKNTPSSKSAGCVFRNPSSELSAGKIIDQCKLKGFSAGDACVSEIHANYLVNQGNASEADFESLMSDVRKKVFVDTGIILKSEIKFANPQTEARFVDSVKPIRIALLKGGSSSEREISLKSASYVSEALRKAGHDVVEIDVDRPEVTDTMRQCEIVFPVLHGGFGENGILQAELEKNGISFVGSGSSASALCMDKVRSKEKMLAFGIPTPPYKVVSHEKADFPKEMGLPLIVKPPEEGSTVGISIVTNISEWEPALIKVFSLGSKTALVEKFIDGTEITVGIVGEKALTPIEIRYPGKIYDFDAKYVHQTGETQYLCPPETVTIKEQKTAKEIATCFFHAIGARDMLRVDIMIAKKDRQMFVLEGNSIPGFTESSLLPKAARHDGISFVELCAMLAKFAYDRRNQQ